MDVLHLKLKVIGTISSQKCQNIAGTTPVLHFHWDNDYYAGNHKYYDLSFYTSNLWFALTDSNEGYLIAPSALQKLSETCTIEDGYFVGNFINKSRKYGQPYLIPVK